MKRKFIVFLLFLFLITNTVSYGVDLTYQEVLNLDSSNSVSLQDSIKKSTLNKLITTEHDANDELESKYDTRTVLAEKGVSVNVKNQEKSGTCWAFAASNILEIAMGRKYGINVEYSPLHICYRGNKVYNFEPYDGGNKFILNSYFMSRLGPVLESDFPFEKYYNTTENSQSNYYLTPLSNVPEDELNQKLQAKVKGTKKFPKIYKTKMTDSKIQYRNSSKEDTNDNIITEEEVLATRKLIKEYIKKYGAVYAAVKSWDGGHNGIYSSYNPSTKAAYYNHRTGSNDLLTNHAVAIVGWDDTFSKDNFTQKPVHDGAYIILNNYGESYGDGGYIYVSYDDDCIEAGIFGIKDVEKVEDGKKEKLYEYDPIDFTLRKSAIKDDGTKLKEIYAANVFTRENSSSEYEYLEEVGLQTSITEGVEIYVNPNGEDLDNCTLVATATGSDAVEGNGYSTIKLSSPVRLTGNKFAVKVKYINDELANLPLECNFTDSTSGDNKKADPFDKSITANSGESYISFDGTNWNDINGFTWDIYTFKNTNACIKAMTTFSNTPPTIAVTGVSLDKTSGTIKIGETISLTATVSPKDATNKNILWKSENEKIATVKNGVITGMGEGTTTITVTTVDGNYKASFNVKVEKAEPEKINVTGVSLNFSNGILKVGKTMTLVATVTPQDATNKKIIWSSENERVATVENGVITAVGAGTTKIIVTTEDGNYKDSFTVTVEEEPKIVPITGVQLSASELQMQVKESKNIVATVYPANATNKNVIWKSSNENIATVSETGIIKGISEGKTIITVTTVDGGYNASCEVTVSKAHSTEDDVYKPEEEKTDINKQDTKKTETSSNDSKQTSGNQSKQEETKQSEKGQVEVKQADTNKVKTPLVLPKTGKSRIIIIAFVFGTLALVISFYKYKKLKGIK